MELDVTLPADYPESASPIIYARSEQMDQVALNKALHNVIEQNAGKSVMLDVINWLNESTHEYLIGSFFEYTSPLRLCN